MEIFEADKFSFTLNLDKESCERLVLIYKKIGNPKANDQVKNLIKKAILNLALSVKNKPDHS